MRTTSPASGLQGTAIGDDNAALSWVIQPVLYTAPCVSVLGAMITSYGLHWTIDRVCWGKPGVGKSFQTSQSS